MVLELGVRKNLPAQASSRACAMTSVIVLYPSVPWSTLLDKVAESSNPRPPIWDSAPSASARNLAHQNRSDFCDLRLRCPSRTQKSQRFPRQEKGGLCPLPSTSGPPGNGACVCLVSVCPVVTHRVTVCCRVCVDLLSMSR